MASRNCLGLLYRPAYSRVPFHSRAAYGLREYATAQATLTKPKPSVAARGAAKSASHKPSTVVRKASAKPTAKATQPSVVRSEATALSATASPATPHPSITQKNIGGTAYAVPAKQSKELLTEEEQLAQVDQIISMARLFPTADPWGQKVDTLDVMIPYSIGLRARRHYPSWRVMLDQFFQNCLNSAKNATSMLLLAQADAVPGTDLSEAKFYHKFITQWPWRLFTTRSIKPSGWMAPLRGIALETYKELNVALAQQDGKGVKRVTSYAYQDNTLRLLKKRQNPSLTYIWRFHREVTPTRIVSIRGTEGYLASEDPKFGNRMMVHALVRFDTEQSLEVYDKRGVALHASGPAEKRRVTEYLVMEKRMWYDGPWLFREQLWEAPGMKEVAV